MSSAEKKRLRDRRAQQNLRDKKLRYTTNLEERVAHCEQHHSDQGVQRLLDVIRGLKRQNETLISWRERLRMMVNSSDVDLIESSSGNPAAPAVHPQTGGVEESISPRTSSPEAQLSHNVLNRSGGQRDSSLGCFSAVPTASICSPSTQQPSPSQSIPPAINSPWKQLPLHNDDFYSNTTVSCPWFLPLEEIIPCPDIPSSPLDILYGSKTNPLADMINTVIQRRPIRDPEHLALGWLLYLLTRWLISPSPATYNSLPPFLRPTSEQLQTPHPMILDFPTWPKLRVNLIQQWHLIRDIRDDLFGLLSCCVKVRWPWGVPILERNDQNELCMKLEFFDIFMSEEGWGLTPEFIARYPQLLDGMDVSEVIHEVI